MIFSPWPCILISDWVSSRDFRGNRVQCGPPIITVILGFIFFICLIISLVFSIDIERTVSPTISAFSTSFANFFSSNGSAEKSITLTWFPSFSSICAIYRIPSGGAKPACTLSDSMKNVSVGGYINKNLICRYLLFSKIDTV